MMYGVLFLLIQISKSRDLFIAKIFLKILLAFSNYWEYTNKVF